MTQIWEREFKIEVIIIIYAVNDCLKELQKRIILNLDQPVLIFGWPETAAQRCS